MEMRIYDNILLASSFNRFR